MQSGHITVVDHVSGATVFPDRSQAGGGGTPTSPASSAPNLSPTSKRNRIGIDGCRAPSRRVGAFLPLVRALGSGTRGAFAFHGAAVLFRFDLDAPELAGNPRGESTKRFPVVVFHSPSMETNDDPHGREDRTFGGKADARRC